MKIVVTHNSPDWDAITSVWLLKRFLPGWEDAIMQFVPAGERFKNEQVAHENFAGSLLQLSKAVEEIGNDEVIHVDTGLGVLDHHQTDDKSISAAGLTWEYVKDQRSKIKDQKQVELGQKSDRTGDRIKAIGRLVKVVVDIDHFKEVFWIDAAADYHEFSLLGVLEGLKVQKPDQDKYYVDFGMQMLDAVLHAFENKIWAEREIAQNGHIFDTKWGKGIGIETINDSVLHLAQKMGYVVVIRKDPRKNYVRIKARPSAEVAHENNARGPAPTSSTPVKQANSSFRLRSMSARSSLALEASNELRAHGSPSRVTSRKSNLVSSPRLREVDLTPAYEELKKMDPDATWFLHVSKKMLLNGTVKNPKMKPTSLTLSQIISILKTI